MSSNKGTLLRKDDLLKKFDEEELLKALNIVPQQIHGMPFQTKVRRGEIERRRVSLLKHKSVPGMVDSQELFRLARYVKDNFVTIAWAIRSTVTGDYYVFSKGEW